MQKSSLFETIASLPGFGMAPEGHLSYSAGLNIRARRTPPCSVRVRIDPIPPKGLPPLQTCHRQRSSLPVAPTRDKHVRGAVTRPIGTSSSSGRCTTWGISTCGVPVISSSRIRSIIVRNVISTSRLTCRIWRHPVVSIPTASSIWRCGSSWRMACPTARRVGTCGATTASLCRLRRSRTGSRRGGKKAQARMDTDFLDWALADFSGYVAADELYDGPFCILSAVDNRRYKRLLYEVLDHDPDHDDIRAFLRRLQAALTARDLTLCGVTTDGSSLSPAPLREVFGDVPHQICTFHIMAEIGKAVLGAVASARKGLAAQQPKLRRGRPSTPAAKQAARTKKRL